MSDTRIDKFGLTVPSENILAGNPVGSHEWSRMARLHNWIVGGRVQVLVPATIINATILASGAEQFRFYAEPTFEPISRVWAVYFDTATVSTGTHGPNGSTAQAFSVATSDAGSKLHTYLHHPVSQSSSAAELVYDIFGASGSANTTVVWIACFALPRVAADPPSSEIFVSVPSVAQGQPIHNSAGDTSLGEGFSANNEALALNNVKRSQFHWTCDDNDTTLTRSTTNTASWDSMFDELEPALLGRLLYNGDTTYTVKFRVRAKGDGKVRITMASGDVATINNNFGGSFAWSSAEDLDIHAEDLDTSDGRRSSTWDNATIDFQANSGTFEVSAISIYDHGGT